MWTKVLGIICAGIFIGAAVVEYKQIRLRKRAGHDGESEAEPAAGEEAPVGEEPVPTT